MRRSYPVAPPSAVRNPGLALVLSLIVPGVGQIYNGQVGKGIGMLAGSIISVPLMAIGIGWITAIGIWIWAMIDAYNVAKASNQQR